MNVLIRGRMTKIMFPRRRPKAWCETQTGEAKMVSKNRAEIRVLRGQEERDELETLVHELAHVAWWDLDEDAITQGSHAIAHALHNLGWRKVY